MSFAGHVLCQRMLIGPLDDVTAGAPFSAAIANTGTAVAVAVPTAARFRNLRREVSGSLRPASVFFDMLPPGNCVLVNDCGRSRGANTKTRSRIPGGQPL